MTLNHSNNLIKKDPELPERPIVTRELSPLAKRYRNTSVIVDEMITSHFPEPKININELNPVKKSKRTLLLENRWRRIAFDRLFSEPGASRDFYLRGIGEEEHLEKSTNQTMIANRGALVSALKRDSLPNLIEFAESLNQGKVADERQERLKTKSDRYESDPNPNQKVFTIDISRLKAIDTAGEADFLLNEVASILVSSCGEICQMDEFKDQNGESAISLLPYRPGGDEFTMVLKAPSPEVLQKLIEVVNKTVIEDSIKKIQTIYGVANEQGVIEVKSGNVQIKNGVPFDESRPEIKAGDEESQIKALLYDLILCEINLLPDEDHLNNAFVDVENYGDPALPLMDRFADYFKFHWERILDIETSLPDYEEYIQVGGEAENAKEIIVGEVEEERKKRVAVINEEQLLKDTQALCYKFPGIQILVDIAKKADESLVNDYISQDYEATEEVKNMNLRSLINVISENLFDPVVGEKVYNKHAFDELVKHKQLSGLVVFKEVIKPVNDNLGLANGDKVIRDFFQCIRSQIPPELEKYIIYGRGQADILIGFNRNEIDKISDEMDRLSVISQINQTIDNLSQMQTFESVIEKNKENITFTMNTGVGSAKLDPETGALVPAEMGKCFDAAETDFDLKFASFILKNNPAKICKTLLLEQDNTDKLYSDPDLWNLYKYLNDPKRGVINTSRILKNLKENISQLTQYLNIADLQAEIVLLEESLTQLRRKLEIERTINQLNDENTELEKNLGNDNLTNKLPRLKIAVNINELASQERMLADLNSEVEKEFDKIESNRIFA